MINSRSTFHPTLPGPVQSFRDWLFGDIDRAHYTEVLTAFDSMDFESSDDVLRGAWGRREKSVGRIWPPPGIRSKQSHRAAARQGVDVEPRTTTRSSWRPWIAGPLPRGVEEATREACAFRENFTTASARPPSARRVEPIGRRRLPSAIVRPSVLDGW